MRSPSIWFCSPRTLTDHSAGGALGCWNHPLEVIRVEIQSLKAPSAAAAVSAGGAASAAALPVRSPTILSTAKYIYAETGLSGLFRGVTPRVALGVWRTVCLVSLGDHVKALVKKDVAASGPD